MEIGLGSAHIVKAVCRGWPGFNFPPVVVFPCQVASLPEGEVVIMPGVLRSALKSAKAAACRASDL